MKDAKFDVRISVADNFTDEQVEELRYAVETAIDNLDADSTAVFFDKFI